MSIKDRFDDLKLFADNYTKNLEAEIRRFTGINNYRCFVHDEFMSAFPEDHLTRAGDVMISLRLTIDLKGFGEPSVNHLKKNLLPLTETMSLLRPNFADSKEEVDFDWHITEAERKKDDGQAFALRIKSDCERLTAALNSMMKP